MALLACLLASSNFPSAPLEDGLAIPVWGFGISVSQCNTTD
jgi:hypothetical protein